MFPGVEIFLIVPLLVALVVGKAVLYVGDQAAQALGIRPPVATMEARPDQGAVAADAQGLEQYRQNVTEFGGRQR